MKDVKSMTKIQTVLSFGLGNSLFNASTSIAIQNINNNIDIMIATTKKIIAMLSGLSYINAIFNTLEIYLFPYLYIFAFSAANYINGYVKLLLKCQQKILQ